MPLFYYFFVVAVEIRDHGVIFVGLHGTVLLSRSIAGKKIVNGFRTVFGFHVRFGFNRPFYYNSCERLAFGCKINDVSFRAEKKTVETAVAHKRVYHIVLYF